MSNVVVLVQIGRGEFLRKKAKTKDIYQNDTTVCYFVYVCESQRKQTVITMKKKSINRILYSFTKLSGALLKEDRTLVR